MTDPQLHPLYILMYTSTCAHTLAWQIEKQEENIGTVNYLVLVDRTLTAVSTLSFNSDED